MLTVYHLAVSQSDRVVWMLEELGIDYQLEWFDRGDDLLAPPEYLELHPAGMSPVVRDGDKLLTESAAILEYLSYRYADGKYSVKPEEEDYADYLYWMHFNNNVQSVFFLKMALGGDLSAVKDNPVATTAKRREERYYQHLNDYLEGRNYLAADRFTCADMMIMFNLTALPLFGGRGIDDLPNVKKYVEGISQRPAYQKAMAIAGPGATKPEA
ncbi:glutathione S-transferase [Litorivivens lipolytica]|uniref:Glutathione S-transferase n=1 Tax=Litorivivens lipolytica TaxID=1524264 RepID=A0A7W4Z605_9GAMM|nr:glutathione S-transferase [Litorivivens lipolytica]MBB3046441.1 glutathione S-transferase [Litorivivens lipolytica]